MISPLETAGNPTDIFGRKEAQKTTGKRCTRCRAYRRAKVYGRSLKCILRIFAAKRIRCLRFLLYNFERIGSLA